ncbi:MAG: cation transporter dimerization domain-containing protein [Verrucomicrobiota bacterium]|nr:cation transporter dimerization domain-containing protein [Verrucomicrobiota bacterium]
MGSVPGELILSLFPVARLGAYVHYTDDDATVRDAHAMATDVERAVRKMLGGDTVVTNHLEPK